MGNRDKKLCLMKHEQWDNFSPQLLKLHITADETDRSSSTFWTSTETDRQNDRRLERERKTKTEGEK